VGGGEVLHNSVHYGIIWGEIRFLIIFGSFVRDGFNELEYQNLVQFV
jgi:hypothetical protein